MTNMNTAPIQQVAEQQQLLSDSERSVAAATEIALTVKGLKAAVPQVHLADGRILPGGVILGSS